ncbi:hypothetical protein IJ182_07645 [bacterium]|nr:hypothetical protein [bacterium]
MNISPISFGSLMVGTLKSGRPKAPVPVLVDLAFNCETVNIDGNERKNPLSRYNLMSDIIHHEEKIDGTVHNANLDFAKELNTKYKSKLPKGSNKVIMTEADFYINPRETEKRYFLTAASQRDEKEIHKVLSKSKEFYTVRYR